VTGINPSEAYVEIMSKDHEDKFKTAICGIFTKEDREKSFYDEDDNQASRPSLIHSLFVPAFPLGRVAWAAVLGHERPHGFQQQ